MHDDRKRTVHAAMVTRILEGEGHASHAQRRAAFTNAGLTAPLRALVDKVAMQPARITDDDIAAVNASGLSEDQIFELVVCAAVGQATRQYETALDALAAAATEGSDGAS
jgi:alkylhydroperoxidase family enzyme